MSDGIVQYAWRSSDGIEHTLQLHAAIADSSKYQGTTMTTLLQQIAPAIPRTHLDVELAIAHVAEVLARDDRPAEVYTAASVLCRAHAEQLKTDHVDECLVTLPSGMTTHLPRWDSDFARLTYRLLRAYEEQALRLARTRD